MPRIAVIRAKAMFDLSMASTEPHQRQSLNGLGMYGLLR
jgi:predicted DNA-binding helix-hairpin-helix protein